MRNIPVETSLVPRMLVQIRSKNRNNWKNKNNQPMMKYAAKWIQKNTWMWGKVAGVCVCVWVFALLSFPADNFAFWF